MSSRYQPTRGVCLALLGTLDRIFALNLIISERNPIKRLMNIKGLLGNILPTSSIRGASKTERAIKSDSTADRDANGQQAGGGDQQHREPMTDEQIQKSLEQLRNLAAVKEHNWTVELTIIENKKFVLIKDTSGTVIRRIPELDLWTLPSVTDPGAKGQLLKKSA